jgi:hypothetical protein
MPNRNDGFAIASKVLLTFAVLLVKDRIDKCHFMFLGKVGENMITANSVATIGGIWTAMRQVQYSHKALMNEPLVVEHMAWRG